MKNNVIFCCIYYCGFYHFCWLLFKRFFCGSTKLFSFFRPQFLLFITDDFIYFFVNRKTVDTIMVGMYAVYFIYGIKTIPSLIQAQQLEVIPVANKNVVGFFLVPFLA